MKVEVLTVNEANRNFRVYPRNTVEEAIIKLEDKLKEGHVLVALRENVGEAPDFLTTAAAFVKEASIENRKVVLDIDFLDNPNGYALKEGIEKGYLHIRPSGFGNTEVRRNGLTYVTNYEFIGFFGTDDPA